MIFDRWQQFERFASLHPGFPEAFDALSQQMASGFSPGKHVFLEDRLWIIAEQATGRTPEFSPLEVHRKMIDIQLVLAGDETIGWRSLGDCRLVQQPYDSGRDIGFFSDEPVAWIKVPPNHFCIFFPNDAHAPLAGVGVVRKAIAKVAVDW